MDKQECNLTLQSCKLIITYVWTIKYVNDFNKIISKRPLEIQYVETFVLLVGYDVTFNEYGWYRPPTLHNNIHLDNHDVGIEPFKDTYVSEGS